MSLFMAFVVLFSTMSFTINMHYCGNTLVDTAIFKKAKNCGMDMQNSTTKECSMTKKNCCSDKQIFVDGQDELKISFNQKTLSIVNEQLGSNYQKYSHERFLSGNENDYHKAMISVQALEDSVVYTAKYANFINLTKENPVWNEVYREILVRNYMRKSKREIEFVLYNAKQRLDQCFKSSYIDINRIPKTYLASYLGIAPPSLSRLLRDRKEN